jgi:hypothetical protein
VLEAGGELERSLASELDYHACGVFDFADGEDVLERQRLEVQPVGGVVVGRDCLRVAVDHDRVASLLPDGLGRVNAAVVELDPLADPVRPRAEDHDARALAAIDLAVDVVVTGAFPRGVVVRRARGELGRARVDRLVRAGAGER